MGMVMLGPASLTLGSWTGVVGAPVQAERNPLPRSRGCLNPSSSATTDCNSINGSPTLLRLLTQRDCGRRSTFKFQAAVTAVDSDQLGSPDSAEKGEAGEKKKYCFVVANAKFMLDEEEHFKEVLFERIRNYGERDKEQDFWLVIEPKFLDKFPNITKRLRRPAVALVSTNAPWITFMKLRLDRVLSGSYEADSLEEALASNPASIEFEKPENWVAPYPKYESGWWEPFLPPPTHHQNLS